MKTPATNRTPFAVILGMDEFIGLQTARILHARDVPVIGVAEDPNHYCCRTNAVQEVIEAEFIDDDLLPRLMSLGAQLDEKAVLFPCVDLVVELVSRHQDALRKHFHVALPDNDTVEMLMNKERFCRFALSEDLPIPKTFMITNRDEAQEAAAGSAFPCVVKPTMRSVGWMENIGTKAFKTWDAQELMRTYDRCAPWADVIIAQEWVDGPETNLYSCNCYYDSGSKLVCTFVARKLRQWPPETGVTSLGEECRDDTVLEMATDLFGRVAYKGLGYVEIKKSAKTGHYRILEANIGRPTGRSALAEFCGVDLVFTMYCEQTGRELPTDRLVQQYRGGKWIQIMTDIQASWYRWRAGELSVSDWVKSLRGKKHYAVFSTSDFRPFARQVTSGLETVLRSIFRGRPRESRKAKQP